jgi:anthranilate synthase component 1
METSTRQKVILQAKVKRHLADIITPVSLYLKVRDHYTEPVLLESNDYGGSENSFSFLGLEAIGSFMVKRGVIRSQLPGQPRMETTVAKRRSVAEALHDFLQHIEVRYENGAFSGFNGLFGHVCFDAVQYFDTLRFDPAKRKFDLPDLRFTLYRYVVAINHFKNELHFLENLLPGQSSGLAQLESLMRSQKVSEHEFQLEGEECSNLVDEEFLELVRLGKKHCHLGDVFQIVFSRQFSQRFRGDDFNVYRVLRSINPSPYLFYFDYGNYKIFGSSPEAQLVIRDGVAAVNPIAGTYRRSGDALVDSQKARELAADPKENAEHIMLVDLARNDLGRHADKVEVKTLKAIQFFSHVIHLVSRVEGVLPPDTNPIRIFGDTFPAGTLSGAPKYKALELIDRYENQNRSFYGGAIGFIDFKGGMNQAIVIRSFLSQDNTLYYQAGAGIVADSVPEKELDEVNNKLGALKKALIEARQIS